MKRSDAVKVISIAIDTWNGAYYDESLESYILSELEHLGMLPPKSLDSVCVKKGKVTGYSMFFEWEDEDEKE